MPTTGQMESTLNPPTAFLEVREIMLQPAPWTDEEIEQLWRQEPLPLNQGANLPANETNPEHDQ